MGELAVYSGMHHADHFTSGPASAGKSLSLLFAQEQTTGWENVVAETESDLTEIS
jgi:hypothetical protein